MVLPINVDLQLKAFIELKKQPSKISLHQRNQGISAQSVNTTNSADLLGGMADYA
jgi:hypothetical protein